jgi:hypothetical protein
MKITPKPMKLHFEKVSSTEMIRRVTVIENNHVAWVSAKNEPVPDNVQKLHTVINEWAAQMKNIPAFNIVEITNDFGVTIV